MRRDHPWDFPIILAIVALLRIALVMTIDRAYGMHRDELLYFAMADHLDLWRMQFPPFIAMVARAGLELAGNESIWAARIPAALAGTVLTGVVMLITRRLRGSTLALAFTATAMLAGPIVVRPAVLLQPVVFDQLWYAVAALGLVIAAQRDVRGWLWLGVGLGLGGLTKFSVAFFAFGIVTAVMTSGELRRALRTRWPWMAAGLALFIALPSLTGQQVHGWPFLVQAEALRSSQLAHVTARAYFSEQGLMFGGAFLLLPFAAVAAARDVTVRPLGVAALSVVLLLFALNGKAYYAAPVYLPLIAVGAVAVERIARERRWLAPMLLCGIVAIGAVLVPAGAPVLEPAAMSRYATRLGITGTNRGTSLALPQDYADMTGWREEVAAAASAWLALPAAERARTQILAVNYGRAGALARYGPAMGLPYPISLHGDFWVWSAPRIASRTRNLLVVGESPEAVAALCEEATRVRTVDNPLGVEEEQHVDITFCRGLRVPLDKVWERGPEWG